MASPMPLLAPVTRTMDDIDVTGFSKKKAGKYILLRKLKQQVYLP